MSVSNEATHCPTCKAPAKELIYPPGYPRKKCEDAWHGGAKVSNEAAGKLEALNSAFQCAYIECPGHVIDDLKRRFDEYLAAVLAHSASAPPQVTGEQVQAAIKKVLGRVLIQGSASEYEAKFIADELNTALARPAQPVTGEQDVLNKVRTIVEWAKSKTPCASNYECLLADLLGLLRRQSQVGE